MGNKNVLKIFPDDQKIILKQKAKIGERNVGNILKL